MTNLVTNLTSTAATNAEQDALRINGQGVTYAPVARHGGGRGRALRANGIQPGDRVAIILPNVPAFPVVYWGHPAGRRHRRSDEPAAQGRRDRLLLHRLRREDRLRLARLRARGHQGRPSGTQIIECGPMGPVAGSFEGGDPITDPHERADDDTKIILYTSGTTGRPKGAGSTHSNIHFNALRSAKVIQQMTADDIVMGCLPLFHVSAWSSGSTPPPSPGHRSPSSRASTPAAAIEVIEKERVTIMQGVPTMYAAILNHPASDGMDASSLRTCASGGSAMPLEVMRSFEEKFGCVILEGYGLSETSPVASFNMPTMERKPGTIGVAIPGCEMRCVDLDGNEVPVGEVGEIAIRGDNVMKGYRNKPEATAEAIPDGWFRTGDPRPWTPRATSPSSTARRT